MSVEVVIHLPDDLAVQAKELGLLSGERIAELLRADIQAQLRAMAEDSNIQRELAQIEVEFAAAEADGLDNL